MTKSLEESLLLITEWRNERCPVRLGYSRPYMALWFPSGTIMDVSGSVFTFSFNSGELTADLKDCEIIYDKMNSVPPNLQSNLEEPPKMSVLQISTKDGGLMFMYALTRYPNRPEQHS